MGLIENRFSPSVITTTVDGQENPFGEVEDSHPLLSRCIDLPMARRDHQRSGPEYAIRVATRSGLRGRRDPR